MNIILVPSQRYQDSRHLLQNPRSAMGFSNCAQKFTGSNYLDVDSPLKYAGLSRTKLIHIHSLFVRSYTEYCSVAWHDSLTQEQVKKAIERLQLVSLKIILGADCPRKPDDHFDYIEALRLCNLKSLFDRRESPSLSFGKKSIKHLSLKQRYLYPSAFRSDW